MEIVARVSADEIINYAGSVEEFKGKLLRQLNDGLDTTSGLCGEDWLPGFFLKVEVVPEAAEFADTETIPEWLVPGVHVWIVRGNVARGPETGPGFGRRVFAQVLEVGGDLGYNARCVLLGDDPNTTIGPTLAGEVGRWSVGQLHPLYGHKVAEIPSVEVLTNQHKPV